MLTLQLTDGPQDQMVYFLHHSSVAVLSLLAGCRTGNSVEYVVSLTVDGDEASDVTALNNPPPNGRPHLTHAATLTGGKKTTTSAQSGLPRGVGKGLHA